MQDPSLSDLFCVRGKSVLITGGGGGIGRMLTETFLRAGAKVTITGRKPEALDRVREEFAPLGELRTITGDLSTGTGAQAVAEAYLATGAPLNVVINNAGRAWGAPLEAFPVSAWADVFAVNVQAPFVLVQALLPALKACASTADPARVINIGSIYGLTSKVQNSFSYSASKAALHQLTRVLASELAAHQILVNAIAPGLFPSNMTEFVFADDGRRQQFVANIPLGRHGTREDIGGLCVFLSSRAGSYITGTIIPLDGGVVARG